MYIWIKSLHLIFMVTWFAGLFYLPRLFVYHASAEDRLSIERFKIMERKLFHGIMTPGAALTIFFGIWLAVLNGGSWVTETSWFHIKLGFVGVLIAYHVYLGRVLNLFRDDANPHGHVFYRWINEFPVLILFAVILLAVVKPAL
jgi:putative membrane protein